MPSSSAPQPDAESGDQPSNADQVQLERLGYRQELRRGFGTFSSFALSFSVISILTGAVQLYGWGLKHGGPAGVLGGWLLVSVLTLPMALSLGQLASAYPTAGALYHWSTILGGPKWGFVTAWLNTLGQVAITAAIDYGLAEFLCGLLNLEPNRSTVLLTYALLLSSHAMLNHVGVKAVDLLSTLSAWYHLAAVALVVAAVGWWAPLQPMAFAFSTVTSESSYAMGFMLGLLQAQWTFTGYDASAHVTEETVDPSRAAPKAIVSAVVVSAIAGFALLIAVTLSITDLPALLALPDAQVFPQAVAQALGPQVGAAVVVVCAGAMWFCGLGSLTSNSRMLYAFARDGGLPAARQLARVSPRWQSPHLAVWACAGCALLLALWADAYAAITALSTIALYASYALPVALGMASRRRGSWSRFGPFDLKQWSLPVNAIAVGWTGVVMVLFVLPPNQLAGYAFVGTLVWLAGYWLLYQRTRFRPPIRSQ